MSRKTKITLIIISSILLVCLLIGGGAYIFLRNIGQGIAQSTTQDPAKAAAMGSEIADMTLPTGYSAQTAMNVMGMKMVVYGKGKTSSNMIILMEMPSKEEITDDSFDQMRQQMESQNTSQIQDVKIVKDSAATIRGKPGRIVIQEGTSSDGAKFRQMMVAFQGKNGMAFLTVTGPSKGWNQKTFDKLVKSIK